MKHTLVFFLITVIYNVNVFGAKQSLRSSKDTVSHYVRCGKGDYRCLNDNRDLNGNYRNCENGGRCGRGLIERLGYGRHAEENDRCGCVKGEARSRIQKNNYDDDRCNCFGSRSGRSRDRCGCGGNENVARCECDTKPTMLYIEESESSENTDEEQSYETDGGESPQVITELLHEYGRDFLMIGKVLSEVARRSNYIGATNDGYVTFYKACPPGEIKTLKGFCVSEKDLLATTTTPKTTTKKADENVI